MLIVNLKVEFINVDSKFKASWSSKKKDKWSFNKNDIVELFTYLTNNIYVKFRGKIYKQVIGIPMGCDYAPKVADLFFYWYEHDYISKAVNKPEQLSVIHVLKYCSGYKDDLNVPNASEEICRIVCKEIYPE